MSTEGLDPRYDDLDLWPTWAAVEAMADEQVAAARAVRACAGDIAEAADAAAARLRSGTGRLVYVGAGTSGRIAIQDGVELVPTFSWEPRRLVYLMAGGTEALLSSIEGAEDDSEAGAAAVRAASASSDDVVIGVAASGKTPFTVAAVSEAAKAGALTIGISNNPHTPLLEAATHPILLATGSEVIAGSTRMKAGTAQKIAINLFSTAVMLRLGRVLGNDMVSMHITNRKLRARAVAMVARISGAAPAAAEQALDQAGGDVKRAVLVARGCSPAQAAETLEQAGDNLREAIAGLASSGLYIPPSRS